MNALDVENGNKRLWEGSKFQWEDPRDGSRLRVMLRHFMESKLPTDLCDEMLQVVRPRFFGGGITFASSGAFGATGAVWTANTFMRGASMVDTSHVTFGHTFTPPISLRVSDSIQFDMGFHNPPTPFVEFDADFDEPKPESKPPKKEPTTWLGKWFSK